MRFLYVFTFLIAAESIFASSPPASKKQKLTKTSPQEDLSEKQESLNVIERFSEIKQLNTDIEKLDRAKKLAEFLFPLRGESPLKESFKKDLYEFTSLFFDVVVDGKDYLEKLSDALQIKRRIPSDFVIRYLLDNNYDLMKFRPNPDKIRVSLLETLKAYRSNGVKSVNEYIKLILLLESPELRVEEAGRVAKLLFPIKAQSPLEGQDLVRELKTFERQFYNHVEGDGREFFKKLSVALKLGSRTAEDPVRKYFADEGYDL